ncbi:hypothetical protein HZC35_06995 [Candidatus Saganbacteria bacterium]|nr:hypothetical protein [Candidatus Saganbacteria bacterium]
MPPKTNLEYFNVSMDNPEFLIDGHYAHLENILSNTQIINNVNAIREEIKRLTSEGVKYQKIDYLKLFNLLRAEGAQLTELSAFAVACGMSHSSLVSLPQGSALEALQNIIDLYKKNRAILYSNIDNKYEIIQAMYDVRASSRRGKIGQDKILKILLERGVPQTNIWSSFENDKNAVAVTQNAGAFSIKNLRKYLRISFDFRHQEKIIDILLKISGHYFLIEAKHIDESGGAQDKQISETIDLIKLTEKGNGIHYLSFLDGRYSIGLFGKNSITPSPRNKMDRQRNEILATLKRNKQNYYLNTFGFIKLLEDCAG